MEGFNYQQVGSSAAVDAARVRSSDFVGQAKRTVIATRPELSTLQQNRSPRRCDPTNAGAPECQPNYLHKSQSCRLLWTLAGPAE